MQVYLPGRNDHSTDFELQYRNYYLAADVRQTSIAIALWLLPVLFFAYMDYLLFGSSPIFLGLLAMRFAFCVFSLHTIHSMGK